MCMGRVIRRIGFLILILLAVILLGFTLFRVRMDPVLSSLAKSKAAAETSRLITQAVTRKISQGDLSYERLICFEKDFEGRVTALKTNMQQVNLLKGSILRELNRDIMKIDQGKIGIPLGDLIFPELFSGIGPNIPVRILSVRRSGADFTSDFTQAGINQTLHRLRMQVKVEGTILVLGKIQTFSASGSVLVAETVIVGQVPHTFS